MSCNVTISPPEATIVYQPNKVTVPQMIQAIQNAGFGASVK